MCLFPRLILNKKYLPTKKNGGHPPKCEDERTKYVPIGCGNCIECKKQKAQAWKVRLNEEIKVNSNAHFVTLSFSDEELDKLCAELKTTDTDVVSSIAIRRFTERWRKRYKTALRHFLINELGHTKSERLHFHGLLWYNATNVAKLKQNSHNDAINVATLEDIWQYGMIYVGEYVNNKTINYIIKYVTKIDNDHKGFKQQIFASKGLGKNYIGTPNAIANKYRGLKTREYYTLPNGTRVSLPIYYRNHIYSEDERGYLWCNRLDKETQYILGTEYNIRTQEQREDFERILKNAQEYNIICGYGEPTEKWDKMAYKVKKETIRKLKK